VCDTLTKPTHFVDVTDEFEDKISAMMAFDPEGGRLGAWEDEMRARARFYGSRIGVKYAEVFRQNFNIPITIKNTSELF